MGGKVYHSLIVTAAVGSAFCPSNAGVNSKFAISAAMTAFISMIAMVFPMQACGPARKVKVEGAGLGILAGSQREGLNLLLKKSIISR